MNYYWPGNVRELRSVLERAMLLASAENASRLLPEHLLGFDFQEKTGPRIEEGRPVTWEEHERRVLKWALERNGWSRVATSKELGIARSSLFLKIKRYGLSPSMTQLSRATPIA